MISPKVKLVIFDLDGTLADTAPQIARGVRSALIKNNIKAPTLEEIVHYVGNGADLLLKRSILNSYEVNDNDIDQRLFSLVKQDYLKCYMDEIGSNFTLYPGVSETLNLLKKNGYLLAIATNKPNIYIKPWLEAAGLSSVFDYTIGGGVLPTHKPDPMILLHVCEKLKIKTGEAIMVGDSCNDILGAKNAKIRSVGLTYGYNFLKPLSEYHPDYLFDQFDELKKLLIG